jgi:hypothetical protein
VVGDGAGRGRENTGDFDEPLRMLGDKSEALCLVDRELGLLRIVEYASQAGEA